MDGASYGRMFDGIGNLIISLLIVCAVSIPLAVWKLIDIAIWICGHLSVHVK